MEDQGFSKRGTSLALSLASCTKGMKLLLFFYLQASNKSEPQ